MANAPWQPNVIDSNGSISSENGSENHEDLFNQGFTNDYKGNVSDFYKSHGYERTPMGWQMKQGLNSAFDVLANDPNANKINKGFKTYQKDTRLLRGVFDKVPQAYNTDAFSSLSSQQQDYGKAFGETSANNVANDFLSQGSSDFGSNAVGANLLRSRSLLGSQTALNSQALGAQDKIDATHQARVSQEASIASKLAELSGNYVNSLANYNSQKLQSAQIGYDQQARYNAGGYRIAGTPNTYQSPLQKQTVKTGYENVYNHG